MKTRTIFVLFFVGIFLIGFFVFLALNPEPHFKIVKDGLEVGGVGEIQESDLTVDWLEENCACSDESMCKTYSCGNYLVEVWYQIK